tara:strand:+ start:1162 stop:1590 length:429 start_codon:yes stop_codon:yes gene_type:complete
MNYTNKYLKYKLKYINLKKKLKYINLKKKFNGGMLSNQQHLNDLKKIEDELITISHMYDILENNKCDCLEDIKNNLNIQDRQEELDNIEIEMAALTLRKLELQNLNTQAINNYINSTRGPGSPQRPLDVETMSCDTPEKPKS